MSSLSDRLVFLRRRGRPPRAIGTQSLTVKRPIIPPGPGWKTVAKALWERRIEYPPLLSVSFDNPFVLPHPIQSKQLVFYDLETTGLSGGAGNTAFLVGLGRQRESHFVLTQLFLEDYSGEESMLLRYAQFVDEGLPQVSYNGRSFDSQVLRTRFLINRMQSLNLPQIDLLYPARRLWKSLLPNFSLSTLEREVLGVSRTDDLPGREAPDAWFEWLKGNPGRMAGVFRHNAEDIVSLARLLNVMEDLGKGIHPPSGLAPSFLGMARQWASRNTAQSRHYLETGWANGERPCARVLAQELRREGNWNAALRVWMGLNASQRDFHASIEIAKYLEHRLKNHHQALMFLDGLEGLALNQRQHDALEYRRARIKRKLAKRSSG